MKIIHIVSRKNSSLNGVSVVVPMHIKSQAKFEKVYYVNLCGEKFFGVEGCLSLDEFYGFVDKNDLVIFHELYIFKYIKISSLLRKKGVKYIIVPHCEMTTGAQHHKYLKKRLGNIIFRAYFKGALAIQCLSQYEYDNTFVKNKKFIGTNGIEIPRIKKTFFNDEKVIFTYIGRLEFKQKGLDLLFKAIALIRDKLLDGNCEVHIYGPDEDGQALYLKKMSSRLGLDSVITIHREVSGKEKERVLLETDIFVQTSRFEGMPMGILEAMSYGIPCLITEGTTMTLYLDNFSGWCCKNSVEDIAKNMLIAIESRDSFNEKSKRIRQIAESHFSWDNVSSINIRKYKELMSDNLSTKGIKK